MEWLFEMRSLVASYDTLPVLENINFRVSEKDFIGIIGPNGGGKTTLLRIILGLLKPLKGEIIYNDTLSRKSNIGYLPQISTGDNSYPVTVTDVILSGLMIGKGVAPRMNAADKRKAAMVVEELGLEGLGGVTLNELSGGQMQRVFLGRAIIGEPKLLLLDEPGNFVDSTFENDFYEKLRVLNERMAILMVSHDIGTISAHIKSFACVNGTLHYHPSNEITNEDLIAYGCPIQIVTHGDIPHTVLKHHQGDFGTV